VELLIPATWEVILRAAGQTVNAVLEKPVNWMMMEILEDALVAETLEAVVLAVADVFLRTTVQNSLIKIRLNNTPPEAIKWLPFFIFHLKQDSCQGISAIHQIKFYPTFCIRCFASNF
jgi:hypothetical protein